MYIKILWPILRSFLFHRVIKHVSKDVGKLFIEKLPEIEKRVYETPNPYDNLLLDMLKAVQKQANKEK